MSVDEHGWFTDGLIALLQLPDGLVAVRRADQDPADGLGPVAADPDVLGPLIRSLAPTEPHLDLYARGLLDRLRRSSEESSPS